MKLFMQYKTLKDRYKAQNNTQAKHTDDGSKRLSGEKSGTGTPIQKKHREKPETRKYEGSDETEAGMGLNDTWQSGGESARTGDVAVVPVYAAAVTFDAASRPTEPVVKEEPIESSGLCGVDPTTVATSSLSPHQSSALSTSTHQAGLSWAKQGVTARLGLKSPKNQSRYTHKAVSSAHVVKELGGADKGQEPVGGARRDEVVVGDKDAIEEVDETEMRQEKEEVAKGKEKERERGEETQPISSPTLDESEVCPVSQTFPSRFTLVDNNDKDDDNDDNRIYEVKDMAREEAPESDDDARNANLSTLSTAPFDERPRTGQDRSSFETSDRGLGLSSPTGAKSDDDNPFDVIRATASQSQLTPFTRMLKVSTIFDFDRTQAEMVDERIWPEAGGCGRGLGDGVKGRVAPRRLSSPLEKERRETENDDDISTVYGTNPNSLSRHDDDISIVYGTNPDSLSRHDGDNEVSIGNKRKTLEPDETEQGMGNGEVEPSKMETPRLRKKWREEVDARNSRAMSKGSSLEILESPPKVQTPEKAKSGTMVTTPSWKHIDNNSFHSKPLTPMSRSPTKEKARLNASPFAGGTPTLPALSAFIPPPHVNVTPAPFEDQSLRWHSAQKHHHEAEGRVTETPAEKVSKVLRVDKRISGASKKGKQRDLHSHGRERRSKDGDGDDDWEALLTMATEYTPKRDTREGSNVMEAEAADARVWGGVATNAIDEQAGVTSGFEPATDYPDARTTIVLSDGEDGGVGSRKSRRNVVVR